METLFGLESIAEAGRCVAALGVFDGVHLGHQKVIRRVAERAGQLQVPSLLITFEIHPRAVVSDETPLFITSLRHKLLLFERLAVQKCLVLDFDERMSQMSAADFARRAFADAAAVVLGYDQRFGHDRQGDAALLRRIGREMGFEVEVVEPVIVRGKAVSSTAVRQAISDGLLDCAAEMLGRRVSVFGTVVAGAARGKRLGFPTANLDLHGEVFPPEGVYLTETLARGRRWHSVTNVGRRPTFAADQGPRPRVVVESYLLDFQGDLRGEEMEVVFLEKMRDEVRCRSEEELMRLIAADVQSARSRLAAATAQRATDVRPPARRPGPLGQ